MKLNDLPKVDITLLLKLVAQLESSLNVCEAMKDSDADGLYDFIIEMSKANGLISGIIQESSMLIGDVQSIVKVSQQPGLPVKDQLIDKLLVGFKHNGSNN